MEEPTHAEPGSVSDTVAHIQDGSVLSEAPPTVETDGEQTNWLPLIYEILETIALAVAIWLGVNFATARFIVEGSSMEPNFHTGQMLIVSKLAYQIGKPQRGDVVVFQYPGNLTDDYIKRLIGLPGDTVEIRDSQVFVNGQLLNEPYLPPQSTVPYHGKWTVPEGSYFVLGDNRQFSSDSRSWGMLSEDYIIGKAWVSYWPPQLWGIVPHFEYAAQ
jgi:signal peptidase I